MTTESSFVQPAVPCFDGHYYHWAMLMENLLRSKEYWGLIENGVPAAAEGIILTDAQRKHVEDQTLKDLKAKNYLFQALDRSILETILNKDTAKKHMGFHETKISRNDQSQTCIVTSTSKGF